MAKTISISIFKGGVGKSTTAVSLSCALAQRDKRVLLVDLDQQASATKYLGLDPDQIMPNLYHVFLRQTPPAMAIQQLRWGFDLLPSNGLLAAIEEAMEAGKDEEVLRQFLTPLLVNYDYVVLDSPPGKQMLSFNALCAADWIIATAAAERMAIDGLTDLLNYVSDVLWHNFDHLAGQEIRVLFTMYKANTVHSPGIVQHARKIWRDNVLPILIPESIEFPRSYDKKTPITVYNPHHPGAIAYLRLADWVIENI
jgi:chromosome partitioning protein